MESFKIVQPSTQLSQYVKHYWLLESSALSRSQRIIPTATVELTFHRACPLIWNEKVVPRTSLCGQSFSFSDLRLTGAVNMITVVFHPFGARAFFDIPIYEWKNLMISSESFNIKALQELEDQILNTSDDHQCIQCIENFLISRLHPFKPYNYKRLFTAINTINHQRETLSVARLAESVCLSKKQFQRVFNEYVGTTPKEFMRIVRFQKALFALQKTPSIPFVHLSSDCGYYDQAHMINEFKQFSGYTPKQYLTIWNPYSDYFSI